MLLDGITYQRGRVRMDSVLRSPVWFLRGCVARGLATMVAYDRL